MKASLLGWSMLGSITLSCVSIATEHETGPPATTQIHAVEQEDTAQEAGSRGLISFILELFRGEPKDTAPAPASVDVRLPPGDPQAAREHVPGSDRASSPGELPKTRNPAREDGTAEATHSDVYRAASDLVAEIDILLRNAQHIADGRPSEPPTQPSRHSIHAFMKSLEVREKTAHVQRRLGMIPVEPETTPTGPVVPHDVLRSVEAVIEELRRIKRQLVIKDEIEAAPFVGGKTASLVDQRLRHASILLDALVGRPPSPNEVYMYMLEVHDRIGAAGTGLGATIKHTPPAIEGERTPVECAQQVLRAVYKTVNLQLNLGMDASTVPNLSLENATPSDVFDVANILLAEVARIRVHLGGDRPPTERRHSSKRQWRDVFALALLVVMNLDLLSEAVETSNTRGPSP